MLLIHNTIYLAYQWDNIKVIALENVIAVVYILKLAAHLDQFLLNIASIFPVASLFLSRGRQVSFRKWWYTCCKCI